jgi:hypothetical protein
MSQYEKYIWDFFVEKIGNEYGTAALMGNLYAESALNPTNLQNSYETSLGYTDASYTAAVNSGAYSKDSFIHDQAGYGLAQWTYWSRKEGLYNFWKAQGYSSIGDIELQCNWLFLELIGSYSGVFSTLQNCESIREGSDKVLHDFENPAVQTEAVEILRESYGRVYYEKYAGSLPDEPDEPVPGPSYKKKKGYNFILFNRQRRWRV